VSWVIILARSVLVNKDGYIVLAKCKDTLQAAVHVVNGALFLHLPNLSGSVVFLMKNFSSICYSSLCYAMEIITCSANLVFVVQPTVNRLWKTKGLVLSIFMKRISPTEYTEWQRQLSGELSIMIEKLAQAGDGGGCTPTLFHYYTITYKVVVYAPWECRYTPFISTLHLYVLCDFTYDYTHRDLPLLCVHVQMYISMSTSVQYCVNIFLNLSMANDSDLIGGYMRKLLARYDSIRWVEPRYQNMN
jgi:hypothetical protein